MIIPIKYYVYNSLNNFSFCNKLHRSIIKTHINDMSAIFTISNMITEMVNNDRSSQTFKETIKSVLIKCKY